MCIDYSLKHQIHLIKALLVLGDGQVCNYSASLPCAGALAQGKRRSHHTAKVTAWNKRLFLVKV
jgi:hypothetical protein